MAKRSETRQSADKPPIINMFRLLIPLTLILQISLLVPVTPIYSQDITHPWSADSVAAHHRTFAFLKQSLSLKKLSYGAPVFIRIFKQDNELELWAQNASSHFVLFKTYSICHYSGVLGPKLTEGDLQSPEGFYQVASNQMNPWSKDHLSFNIGYPNDYDQFHGRTGSAIMIHGNCTSTGCFAMTNYYMDQIYSLVDAALINGQPYVPVHIFPFRLTADKLQHYRSSAWFEFWQNLKVGYDLFEVQRVPPSIGVQSGRYVFDEPETFPIKTAQMSSPLQPMRVE